MNQGYIYTRAVNPTLAKGKQYYMWKNLLKKPQIDYTKYIDSWVNLVIRKMKARNYWSIERFQKNIRSD